MTVLVLPYRHMSSARATAHPRLINIFIVQADLMIALVAVIRDLLCEFLSKSLSEKPR